MKTNAKITLYGIEYTIENVPVVRYNSNLDVPPSVFTAGVAKVLRGLLKKLRSDGVLKYEKVWVQSETFAGGDAIDVYVDGADPESFKEIADITKVFQAGTFNGMIDMYEYDKDRNNVLVYDDLAGEWVSCDCTVTFVSANNHVPYMVAAKRREAENVS